MIFFIANRRTSMNTLKQRYGDAHVIDVTSHGVEPWVRFSPLSHAGLIKRYLEGDWPE